MKPAAPVTPALRFGRAGAAMLRAWRTAAVGGPQPGLSQPQLSHLQNEKKAAISPPSSRGRGEWAIPISQKGGPSCPSQVSPGRNLGVAWEVAKSHHCPAVGTRWKILGLGETLRSHQPSGRVGDSSLQGGRMLFPRYFPTASGSQPLPPRPP